VLVALHEAGVAAKSPAYQRGVRFLLDTQLADGSWLVPTRTLATQIYFESGFPHGEHQFISAAGTQWATQALAWSVK
jgi:N-acyl-D-amino-acid deacylase